MTSKALFSRFHPSLRLYRYSVKRTMGLTVLLTIFMLLVCPGYTVMHINRALKGSNESFFDFNSIAPGLILFISLATTAAAVLYLFINFAFLYSRSSSDFFHSLPLNRRGLLASRFFASVLPILLPLTLTYGSMCGVLAVDYIGGSVKLILFGFIFNILIILASAAFSMIFIVCSGSIFDLIISLFTFNVGIAVVQLINRELCRSFLIGFPNTSDFLMFSTPFYYAFATFTELMSGVTDYCDSLTVFTVKLIAVTAISLAASFLLYNRRKSEKSGVSYAYRFIYIVCALIIGVIGAYLVGIIFSEGEFNSLFWVFAAVGSLLAAVTFGAINDRGFKNVKKSLIIGACSVLSMVVVVLCLWSGGFGYSSRIPEGASVKTAEVSFGSCRVTFSDPSLAAKLHRSIVDRRDQENDYNYVEIDYCLKNGQTLKRGFYISYDAYMDILLEIYSSKENIESIRKQLAAFTDMNLSVSVYLNDEEKMDEILGVYLTPAELNAVTEAYLTDLSGATSDSINGDFYMTFDISGFDGKYKYLNHAMNIEKGFKNTIAVIESLHLGDRTGAAAIDTKTED